MRTRCRSEPSLYPCPDAQSENGRMKAARGPSGGRIKAHRSFTGYFTTGSSPKIGSDERSRDYVSSSLWRQRKI